MKALLHIAWRSALNRRGTLSLVVLSIALATALLLSLERLRDDIRASFSLAVSGTDLVVGARTGPVQLMLYAVFRVGGATNNIQMDSVRAIEAHRAVAWVVPIALGDSHHARPVLGTTPEYFTRFAYGDRQSLVLAQGRANLRALELGIEALRARAPGVKDPAKLRGALAAVAAAQPLASDAVDAVAIATPETWEVRRASVETTFAALDTAYRGAVDAAK